MPLCGVLRCRPQSPPHLRAGNSHRPRCIVVGFDIPTTTLVGAASLRAKCGRTMMTSLVDIEDATARLASGEQPYAFETSDCITMVEPACGYGSQHLSQLRTEGRYAESFDEAMRIADARGATVIGIWFVKR